MEGGEIERRLRLRWCVVGQLGEGGCWLLNEEEEGEVGGEVYNVYGVRG